MRPVSGSEASGALSSSTAYSLSCTGAGGTLQRDVAVTVFPAPAAPQGIQGAAGDSSVNVSWQSQAGSYYAGFLVTSNVYVSPHPGIDVRNFVESHDNRKVRGLTIMLPITVKGLANGSPVYVVATDVVDGVEGAPSTEISVTPRPVPLLVENIAAQNDTGVDACADLDHLGQPCPVAVLPNQDAEVGRDAEFRKGLLTKTGFGEAGFDFTKLDSNGVPLPDGAAAWPCARDNVTGLTWQVPGASGLTAANNTYTWYQPDERLNGGFAGIRDGGSCTASECDTHSYVGALNAARHCGFSDWRLPTRRELFSLANFSQINPALDTSVFPVQPIYTRAFYWSSTVNSGTSAVGYAAWIMDVATGTTEIFAKVGYPVVSPAGSALAVRSDATP